MEQGGRRRAEPLRKTKGGVLLAGRAAWIEDEGLACCGMRDLTLKPVNAGGGMIARSSGVVLRHFGQVTFAPSSQRSPDRDAHAREAHSACRCARA